MDCNFLLHESLQRGNIWATMVNNGALNLIWITPDIITSLIFHLFPYATGIMIIKNINEHSSTHYIKPLMEFYYA